MTDQDWRTKAACWESYDPCFFPQRGQPQDKARALQYCRACPVTKECLRYSLTLGSHMSNFGVWGGHYGRDRYELRRQRSQG